MTTAGMVFHPGICMFAYASWSGRHTNHMILTCMCSHPPFFLSIVGMDVVRSKPPFRIKEEGWGQFDLKIVVHFFHCSDTVTIDHYLTFPEEGSDYQVYPFVSISNMLNSATLGPLTGWRSESAHFSRCNITPRVGVWGLLAPGFAPTAHPVYRAYYSPCSLSMPSCGLNCTYIRKYRIQHRDSCRCTIRTPQPYRARRFQHVQQRRARACHGTRLTLDTAGRHTTQTRAARADPAIQTTPTLAGATDTQSAADASPAGPGRPRSRAHRRSRHGPAHQLSMGQRSQPTGSSGARAATRAQRQGPSTCRRRSLQPTTTKRQAAHRLAGHRPDGHVTRACRAPARLRESKLVRRPEESTARVQHRNAHVHRPTSAALLTAPSVCWPGQSAGSAMLPTVVSARLCVVAPWIRLALPHRRRHQPAHVHRINAATLASGPSSGRWQAPLQRSVCQRSARSRQRRRRMSRPRTPASQMCVCPRNEQSRSCQTRTSRPRMAPCRSSRHANPQLPRVV
ncbi:hypothetical protein DL89DRAFT_82559 [Linderina pennispora]|uniref:YEATS domain-containing protein n=1 Tax=Linderina pennispora TaxID=61395 RepID=A0A1Y1WI01_9FUNG|nr:uncharacterized protein DL89DRAFT_82559 [Linderina pennispora]ORX72754.1 hypothetical protein DL89DRAFT_82559 [Linderina pennispora]